MAMDRYWVAMMAIFVGWPSSQVLVELMTRFARRLLSFIYYKSKLKEPSYRILQKSKVL